MKRVLKVTVLLLSFAFIAASCVPEEQKEGWSLYYGFTSNALLGDYYPNEELWENDLPGDYVDYNEHLLVHHIPMVDVGCYVHRWTTSNPDNLQFEFSGIPSDIASSIGHNFTTDVYYSNSNYTFSLNSNSEVVVYKDNNGNVRLHGWIAKLVHPNLLYGGYDVVDEWNYYYFDIVK